MKDKKKIAQQDVKRERWSSNALQSGKWCKTQRMQIKKTWQQKKETRAPNHKGAPFTEQLNEDTHRYTEGGWLTVFVSLYRYI